jgi:hypothetical protein
MAAFLGEPLREYTLLFLSLIVTYKRTQYVFYSEYSFILTKNYFKKEMKNKINTCVCLSSPYGAYYILYLLNYLLLVPPSH